VFDFESQLVDWIEFVPEEVRALDERAAGETRLRSDSGGAGVGGQMDTHWGALRALAIFRLRRRASASSWYAQT
jgi:hypothetical protein